MGKKTNERRKKLFEELKESGTLDKVTKYTPKSAAKPKPKPKPPVRRSKRLKAPVEAPPPPAPLSLRERLTLPCGHRVSLVQEPVGERKYCCRICYKIGSLPLTDGF